MATGTHTYAGGAVPLDGESEITQINAATDILTMTGASSQTGDFIVARNSSETERFVVEDGGNIVITQAAAGDVGIKVVRAASPTANAIEIENSSNKDLFVVNSAGKISRMVITTVALAAMTSNGSQTVTLTGATTNSDVMLFFRADPGGPIAAYVSGADTLTAEALGTATNAVTVGVWFFSTAAEA